MNKNKLGFTLFEMLVVISIIGIILGLISTAFSAAQARARDSRRIQDLGAIQKSLEQYFALCGSYPGGTVNNPYSASPPGFSNTVDGSLTALCVNPSIVVLQKWPNDPGLAIRRTNYFAGVFSSSGYCICANLEIGNTNFLNSTDASCTSGSKYYCVKNAQ